jgi:hypothetical protein
MADLPIDDTLGTSLLSRIAFGCRGEKFQPASSALIRSILTRAIARLPL